MRTSTSKWLLLALLGCDSGSSLYGAKPHMLFATSQFTVHDTSAEVARKLPQAGSDAGLREFTDAAARYRIWFTESGVVESVNVFVKGTRAELEHAWRGGVAGKLAEQPATFYFDGETATAYVAFDFEPGSFIVAEHPFISLTKIFDDRNDVRVFGLDVLHRPLGDVVADLKKLGFDPATSVQDASKGTKFTFSQAHIYCEAGKIEMTLDSNADNIVTQFSVKLGPYELPDRQKDVLALYEKKWGEPKREGREVRYPSEHPKIVQYFDKSIGISDE